MVVHALCRQSMDDCPQVSMQAPHTALQPAKISAMPSQCSWPLEQTCSPCVSHRHTTLYYPPPPPGSSFAALPALDAYPPEHVVNMRVVCVRLEGLGVRLLGRRVAAAVPQQRHRRAAVPLAPVELAWQHVHQLRVGVEVYVEDVLPAARCPGRVTDCKHTAHSACCVIRGSPRCCVLKRTLRPSLE
jgi:hypothetical protein